MAEFDLIDRIRARALQREDVVLGIGDDAAVLQVPAGYQLVVAMDTLNEGVHFPIGTAAFDIGWKALAVNLSDLAAMGALPAWCTLSLSLPSVDDGWVEGFIDGFAALATQHRVALVGGDTTRGPLSISVTVHGFVEPGRALRRDGACAGDEVWVSGALGDAAAALSLLLAPGARSADVVRSASSVPPVPAASDAGPGVFGALRRRLDRPEPRIALGRALAGLANAAIDISDGLLADLGHVARASRVAVEVDVDALPASDALRTLALVDAHANVDRRRAWQAAGGDDYELCFTAPVTMREAVLQAARTVGIGVTRVGRIVEGQGVHAFDAQGAGWRPARRGYMHFAE